VGLFGLGHPELVLVGLGTETTHSILNRVADVVAGGRNLVAGELLTWPDWPDLRLVVEELPNPGEVVLVANRFYERPVEYSVPAYQLTWAFPDHCFPWEGNGPDEPDAQPRPGTWRA
jgi:hypothetical protein